MASSTTTIFGTPAAFSAQLARRAALRALAAGFVAAGVALLALRYHHLLLPGAVLAVVLAYVARDEHVKYKKAQAGTRNERRVAAELNRLGYTATLHGAVLGSGGDCDHVVAGPILCAIETKSGRGPVRVVDGHLTASGRRIPRDPLTQVRRQAAHLERLSGRRVTAFVCVVDATSRPFHERGVTVCSLRDLPELLSQCPPVYSASEALAFATNIWEHQGQIEAAHYPASR